MGAGLSCPGAAGRGARASRFDSRPTATPRNQRFPRGTRLTARRQFLWVYDRGRRASSSNLSLFGLPNDVGHSRLGITVTRRSGGAVRRNRVRRLLREIFRRHRELLTPALDLVVNVRAGAERKPYHELEKEFLSLFADLARRSRR